MKKKIIAIGSSIIVILIILAISSTDITEPEPEPNSEMTSKEESSESQSVPESEIQADVVMPTKVSRPGCEEQDRCYIPSNIVIKKGESVIWMNQDAAFHSVTSGWYDSPTELFDSGYLDPYQSFTFAFQESGTYHYYCTLHPWMEGQVIVQ